jgi:hypothetical protein
MIKPEVERVDWRKKDLWLQLVVNDKEMHPIQLT